MANAITRGKTYVPYLDSAYQQQSKTSILDAEGSLVKMGANGHDILIAKMSLVGLGNTSAGGAYPDGDATLTWETHTPSYERSRVFKVKGADNEETAGVSFGALSGEFLKQHVGPEVDAYRFATYAGTTNISTTTGATLANSGADFLAAIAAARIVMKEDNVDLSTCVLFVTPTVYDPVRTLATTASREALEGFAGIVEIPQSRFYTQIDLNAGATANVGGYIKNSSAGKDINFMIIDKTALIQATKHEDPKVFTPEEARGGNFWEFDYGIYGIASVKENKVDGIYLHKKA